MEVQQLAGPTAEPSAQPAATEAKYTSARARVKQKQEERREKQEKERAVREEELAWLQEFDAKSSRFNQLVKNFNTRSADGISLTPEQTDQTLQQLKQLDPGVVCRGGFWPPFNKLPGSRSLLMRHKYFGRELDLKWLAKQDQWHEERDRLIEASKDRSVSAEEVEATARRLKQFDPR